MGYKRSFAERVVSTAQRLANLSSSRKNPADVVVLSVVAEGGAAAKTFKSQQPAGGRTCIHARMTLFGRGSTFFPCMQCMMLVNHVD
jgi:hypothetical protein